MLYISRNKKFEVRAVLEDFKLGIANSDRLRISEFHDLITIKNISAEHNMQMSSKKEVPKKNIFR